MGQKYCIDTNVLIYYTSDNPLPSNFPLQEIFDTSFQISVVSYMEYLGWKGHTQDKFVMAKEFLDCAYTHFIDENIVNMTIDLLRNYRIKLPDALIAATCLVNHLTLLTRNKFDFERIANLEVINPFEI